MDQLSPALLKELEEECERPRKRIEQLKAILQQLKKQNQNLLRNEAIISDDPQVAIDRIEMGTGWVCFQVGSKAPSSDKLTGYLHHTFYTWLQRNPKFKV